MFYTTRAKGVGKCRHTCRFPSTRAIKSDLGANEAGVVFENFQAQMLELLSEKPHLALALIAQTREMTRWSNIDRPLNIESVFRERV